MQHSTHPPACPRCGATVYRTHTCRVSGLRPQAGEVYVPKPVDFDAQVERARRLARVDQVALDFELDAETAAARLRMADAAWSEDVGL
jgi:hypothetical protein